MITILFRHRISFGLLNSWESTVTVCNILMSYLDRLLMYSPECMIFTQYMSNKVTNVYNYLSMGSYLHLLMKKTHEISNKFFPELSFPLRYS